MENPKTLAELVGGSDNFNILAKALEAAGLTGAVAAEDADLTVFAPNDAAFVKLAQDFGYEGDPADEHAVFEAIAGALAGLAPDGDPIPLLTNVLLYHVSPGAKPLAEVAALDDVPTLLDGATFSPDGTKLVDNEPDLQDPMLVTTDIEASNGIAHEIDRVLIPLDIPGNEPAEKPSLAELVGGSDNFNILAKALEAAGLTGAVAAEDADLTVFAPNDAAFVKLAQDFGYEGDPADEHAVFEAIAGALAGLAPDGDPIPLLTNVLLYHVSPGAKPLAEVAALDDVPTLLDGATFSPDGTKLVDNEPDLQDPMLVTTDIMASNGIAHEIDRVLIPLDIPGNEPADAGQLFTFVDADAAFKSVIGYVDAETGEATVVLANTAKEAADGFSAHLDLPEETLWFLIPDASQLNDMIEAGDGYRLAGDAESGFFIETDDGTALLGRVGGVRPGAYFSDAALNRDGQEHVQMSDDGTMAWEDLFNLGDADFNDVVVRVTDKDGDTLPAMTETAPATEEAVLL